MLALIAQPCAETFLLPLPPRLLGGFWGGFASWAKENVDVPAGTSWLSARWQGRSRSAHAVHDSQ
jgi:hypothetical protein